MARDGQRWPEMSRPREAREVRARLLAVAGAAGVTWSGSGTGSGSGKLAARWRHRQTRDERMSRILDGDKLAQLPRRGRPESPPFQDRLL